MPSSYRAEPYWISDPIQKVIGLLIRLGMYAGHSSKSITRTTGFESHEVDERVNVKPLYLQDISKSERSY